MLSGFLGLIAIVTSAGLIASGSETLTTRCANAAGEERQERIISSTGEKRFITSIRARSSNVSLITARARLLDLEPSVLRVQVHQPLLHTTRLLPSRCCRRMLDSSGSVDPFSSLSISQV